MTDTILLTPLGYQLLREKKVEVEDMLLASQDDLVDLVQDSPDDGFQDSYVLQVQMDVQAVERQLRDLGDLLHDVQPAPRPAEADRLGLGHLALLRLHYPWEETEMLAVVLVASQELSLVEGYMRDSEVPVSANSALGQALFGLRAGDNFSYELDSGTVRGKVLDVEVWSPAFEVTA